MAHGSRKLACFFAGILFLSLTTVPWAGTTGKIAGKVTDSDGLPLPGVAVIVEGTRLGATTDTEGRYLVMQVPPGVRTITARLIGYRPTSVTNTGVSADLTTQLDFVLSVEAVETEAVVIQATRPPIEKDVTSSQIIIGAEQVSNAPVSGVIDYLAYEPGVGIQKENELTIRSGGPEEIRFQVDGMDRTDALTNKGLTHLNQTLVSEVTVLTGGFNAEYGNMRSGVVNAVYKDGTERSWGLPWVAAVVSGAPAQQKHFGPGAYSPEQYDYQLMANPASSGAMMPKRQDLNEDGVQDADEPIVYKADGTPELVPLDNINPIFWSDLYEATRNDTAIQSLRENDFNVYKNLYQLSAFQGWKKRQGAYGRGVYGVRGLEAAELREIWEWTSNMDESEWSYGGKPDYNIDLSIGQALPNRWGGLVIGYSYAKVMTALPAIRNFFSDKTIDVKLTLTPTDDLKLRLNYLFGEGLSSGVAGHGATGNAGLEIGGGGSISGNDPVSIRTPGQLSASLNHQSEDRENNKANLALNATLNGEYTQIGGALTYTLSPSTIFEFGFSRFETEWNQPRVAPRVDVTDFTGGYKHQNSYAWGGKGGFLDFLSGNNIYWWVKLPKYEQQNDGTFLEVFTDGVRDSVNYPTHPDQVLSSNIIPNSPWEWREPYPPQDIEKVQAEAAALFVTKEFIFADTVLTSAGAIEEITYDTVNAVSPQGWYEGDVDDLSAYYNVGGHHAVVMNNFGDRTSLTGHLTHATGPHTLKLGVEWSHRNISYDMMEFEAITGMYSFTRDYTGNPTEVGFYLQDKYESRGLIVNAGARVDMFDAGGDVYTPDSIFTISVWRPGAVVGLRRQLEALYPERVWEGGYTDPSQVPKDPITSKDVVDAIDSRPSTIFWRVSPRVGMSHPVGEHSKLFFNYGHFYNTQQPKLLYGISSYGTPLGTAVGESAIRSAGYSNLRPAKTVMYEVGVERFFPQPKITLTVRGYSKYNTDQSGAVSILPYDVASGTSGQSYSSFRNSAWEDIRGLELKINRDGRFLFGWATYNYFARRAGGVGHYQLNNVALTVATTFDSDAITQTIPNNFSILVGARTPSTWGVLTGGWQLVLHQTWTEGSSWWHNPESLQVRFLDESAHLTNVDTWRSNMKLSKRLPLGGGRSISAYVDVSNVFNSKSLSAGGTKYTEYIIDRRKFGDLYADREGQLAMVESGGFIKPDYSIKYGDPSTHYVFTEPYRGATGDWKPPIAPQNDFLMYLNPRYYRFGVSMNF